MTDVQSEGYSSIEEQLEQNGVYVSTTVGRSMYPMLRNRTDRIVLLPVGERRLCRWELPMYRRPDGKYVLHRIIRVEKDHYVIRGDNTYVKERVPFEWVLGYVSEFYRGDRHVRADSAGYRFYAAFWHRIYGLRVVLRAVGGFCGKVWRKLFGRTIAGRRG